MVEAATTRLRPILMTSITTILAMTPLALGIGEGAESWAPMAVTVIFGLAAATILTLIVEPCIYVVMGKRIAKKVCDRRKASFQQPRHTRRGCFLSAFSCTLS